ncbi:MAG: chemotaxis protein CheW, partial [Candidatus Gastranaerophilales bacterium]|nr:chemotaxis protein CheW [Candidatus Gastranaerophilales bacterium]
KIKSLAVKKGMITSDQAKSMSEKDALDLIFAPGFSTAKVATDLSGRGVGMDVVKSKVASLGGTVGILSRVGQGTTITISLPSNMAILQALLIKVGNEIYGTPLNYISEVIDVENDQVKRIQNKEVIVLRGKTLPLVRLNKLLEIPNYIEDKDKPLTVVIIKSQGKCSGVIVSELLGQQEVVIKPISKSLCSEDYLSGAITLGNGQVALVLNVNALIVNM